MTTKSSKIDMMLKIAKIVTGYYDLTVGDINSKTRKHEILRVRQFVHFFCAIKKVASLDLIGRIIGGKDHTTVMNSKKIIQNLIDTENDWYISFHILENMIDHKLEDYKRVEVFMRNVKSKRLVTSRKASIRNKTPYILVNELEY